MFTTEELEKPIKAAVYNVGLLVVTLGAAFLATSLVVGRGVGEIVWYFVASSVGSADSVLRLLMRATPLLIATLGLLVAFRSGVWNIGGEGQIVLGVIVTTGICLFLPLPPVVAVLLSFVMSFLVSGAYAAVAGFLKARWDVNEIAVTMMQTFVATAVLQYLIDDPWNWGQGLYPRTAKIPVETQLPFLLPPLNSTVLLGGALTLVTYLLLQRTVFGYEVQAMRSNKAAAFSHGIDTARLTVLSMLLSGGLCGLAGTGLVLGEYFRAQAGISGSYGFYAIAAALMAENEASRAPVAALLIAFLSQGALGLIALGVPQRLGEVIIGAVFIVILLPRVVKKGRSG
jgi:ABC-type uncharacterized transport system permease subunit